MVAIFSDISFDPKSRRGVAGLLVIEDINLAVFDSTYPTQFTFFQDVACTQLEISSVIIAMEMIQKECLGNVSIFTD
jgi:hypothetical protein